MSESDRISVYLAVFEHATLEVDWKSFAADQGISLAGNAQRKFKDCLKKDGYQMKDGRIGPISEVDKAPKTPKKKVTRQNKEKTTSAKKRKIEVVEDEGEEQGEGSSNEADTATAKAEESD